MHSVIMVLIALSCAQAQEPAKKADLPEAAAQMPEYLPDYQLGPGDLLTVEVFGLKEFDQTARVSNSGKVHFSYVGTIPVANMTVSAIEDEIAGRLREQQLVKEPWVRVQVTEYRSQPVFVVGELNAPGQFMITGETYLLDVVTRAGGFTTAAGTEAFLMRRRDASGPLIEVKKAPESWQQAPQERPQAPVLAAATGAETAAPAADSGESIAINIKALREGTRPELNMRLRGGDVFYVPTRQVKRIYIVGEVSWPGAYALPQDYGHITAARAVSFAGGPLRTAKTSKAFIMRRDQNGGVQSMPFDFLAITKGKKTDIALRPNDILFVPRSIGKTIAYAALMLVPRAIQQLTIW
jgi:polysaccharide export outer membrane protein